ncbi:MAG: aldo/keto reductase [Planctomycetota bacterium]|jgi:predicted aldo/keto reductase-like oxidoreductase
MKEKQNKIDRRNFLKTVGAVGLGSVFTSIEAIAGPKEPNLPAKAQEPEFPQVPKRKLGKLTQLSKSGKKVPVEVPCLALGMMFNAFEKQIVLRKTIQFGVTYWDTANSYSGGNSELGVGKFLKRNPEVRKKLFIASKASRTKTIEDVEERLQTSLKRMNTDHIDLYYLHNINSTERLNNELRDWAKNAKQRKLIRFFGFTTHGNMTECLNFGAKLDWIDVIMTSYNFRLMQDKKLNAAIDACHKAGIGLIAMKTVGKGVAKKIETEKDRKLVEHFLKRGFTAGQAKIKVVLDDKRFTTVAVGRGNIPELYLNVAAVLDKTRLSQADRDVLTQYAQATCSGYCACCANICSSALPDMPYVSDVMRYLMYYDSYGEQENARQLFAKIPRSVRNKLLSTDYSLAEAHCPQRMPIAKLMAEAVNKLA